MEMIDEETRIKDMRRTEEIERALRNKKRPWYIRQWWSRNILQWLNLIIAVGFGTFTMLKPTLLGKPWDWGDMIIMVMCGANLTIWFWGGFFNKQNDMIDDLLELNKKLIGFTGGIIERIRCSQPYID